jgi:hypothetical protein
VVQYANGSMVSGYKLFLSASINSCKDGSNLFLFVCVLKLMADCVFSFVKEGNACDVGDELLDCDVQRWVVVRGEVLMRPSRNCSHA